MRRCLITQGNLTNRNPEFMESLERFQFTGHPRYTERKDLAGFKDGELETLCLTREEELNSFWAPEPVGVRFGIFPDTVSRQLVLFEQY